MLFLLLFLSLGCINGIQLALIGLLIDRVSLIYMKVRLMGLACVNPLS